MTDSGQGAVLELSHLTPEQLRTLPVDSLVAEIVRLRGSERPMPKDGREFYVYFRSQEIWKWRKYEPGAPKELLERGGRWMRLNDWSGWENVAYTDKARMDAVVWEYVDDASPMPKPAVI